MPMWRSATTTRSSTPHVLLPSFCELFYRPLMQVEEPRLGRSVEYLLRGFVHQSSRKPSFQQVPALVIYLKTLIMFNIKIGACIFICAIL